MPLARVAAVSAGVFAVQMLNVPISETSSGHLLGGAAAVTLVGPWWAVLSLATVVTVQCLVFGDGGTAALGANLWNMAVVAPLVAEVSLHAARMFSPGFAGRALGAAAAGWFSVMTAAVWCVLEISASAPGSLGAFMAKVLVPHALIGVGEAMATVLVMEFTMGLSAWTDSSLRRFSAAALVAVLLGLAPLATDKPDALEFVVTQFGLGQHAAEGDWPAVLAEYRVGGFTSEAVSTIVAGMLGVAACALLTVIAATTVARCRGALGTIVAKPELQPIHRRD